MEILFVMSYSLIYAAAMYTLMKIVVRVKDWRKALQYTKSDVVVILVMAMVASTVTFWLVWWGE